MKILVAVKRVIDYNVRVRVKPDHSDVDLANVKMALNPFCEIAVEQAIRLKEQGIAEEVVVVTIGPKAAQEQLRTALALGADRAIHVETEVLPDSFDVAQLLAALVEREQPELTLLGKQAIDSDNNQTGQMLAALTGRPQGTFASELVVEQDHVRVTREVDGGLRTLSLTLPAIVTTDLRLNMPRYAKLPDIMKAKKKPLVGETPESLGVTLVPRVELLGVEPPGERQPGVRVASVDELLEQLRNTAKVIA